MKLVLTEALVAIETTDFISKDATPLNNNNKSSKQLGTNMALYCRLIGMQCDGKWIYICTNFQ